MMAECNQVLDELQFQLNRAQNIMRQSADKKRRDVVFELGNFVYLKLHPYQMQFLGAETNQKLVAWFYGPFKVLERIGGVAYKLQLPETTKIHPVFHVSLLKRSVDPFTSSQPMPQEVFAKAKLLVQLEQILDNRKNDKGELEVLVKWQHLPDFENS